MVFVYPLPGGKKVQGRLTGLSGWAKTQGLPSILDHSVTERDGKEGCKGRKGKADLRVKNKRKRNIAVWLHRELFRNLSLGGVVHWVGCFVCLAHS